MVQIGRAKSDSRHKSEQLQDPDVPEVDRVTRVRDRDGGGRYYGRGKWFECGTQALQFTPELDSHCNVEKGAHGITNPRRQVRFNELDDILVE